MRAAGRIESASAGPRSVPARDRTRSRYRSVRRASTSVPSRSNGVMAGHRPAPPRRRSATSAPVELPGHGPERAVDEDADGPLRLAEDARDLGGRHLLDEPEDDGSAAIRGQARTARHASRASSRIAAPPSTSIGSATCAAASIGAVGRRRRSAAGWRRRCARSGRARRGTSRRRRRRPDGPAPRTGRGSRGRRGRSARLRLRLRGGLPARSRRSCRSGRDSVDRGHRTRPGRGVRHRRAPGPDRDGVTRRPSSSAGLALPNTGRAIALHPARPARGGGGGSRPRRPGAGRPRPRDPRRRARRSSGRRGPPGRPRPARIGPRAGRAAVGELAARPADGVEAAHAGGPGGGRRGASRNASRRRPDRSADPARARAARSSSRRAPEETRTPASRRSRRCRRPRSHADVPRPLVSPSTPASLRTLVVHLGDEVVGPLRGGRTGGSPATDSAASAIARPTEAASCQTRFGSSHVGRNPSESSSARRRAPSRSGLRVRARPTARRRPRGRPPPRRTPATSGRRRSSSRRPRTARGGTGTAWRPWRSPAAAASIVSGRSSSNAAWSARTAVSRASSAMIVVIRISDVEIISMFTPASARALNIRAA